MSFVEMSENDARFSSLEKHPTNPGFNNKKIALGNHF